MSLIDFYGQGFINKIDLRVNNRPVLDGSGFNYHTKVLLNTLLNYDKTASTTHLRAAGFYADKDVAPSLEATDLVGKGYEDLSKWTSLKKHKERFAKSQWVETSIDIQLDVARCSREWPNDMNIELEIHRNSDDYMILQGQADTGSYSVEMKDLQVFVRKIQPSPELLKHNDQLMLSGKPAVFRFNNWIMDQYVMPAGQKSFNSLSLFRGRVPCHSFYVLVEQDAYVGNPKKNPSLFKTWQIESLLQRINGIESPHKAQKYDWANSNFAESYRNLFDNLNITTLNQGNLIDIDSFKSTRFCAAFQNSVGGVVYDDFRERREVGDVT